MPVPWVAGGQTSCRFHLQDHARFAIHFYEKTKLPYLALIFAYLLKNTCTVTQRATCYKQRIFNARRTPVDKVTQNQPCINVERSSIMSQSG